MAMIDYGAVAIKNGAVVPQKELFGSMEEQVGWSDEGRVYYYTESDGEKTPQPSMDANYFVYIGDEDFTLGFYKTCCRETDIESKEYVYVPLFQTEEACKYDSYDEKLFHHMVHTDTFKTREHGNVSVKTKYIADGVLMTSVDYKGDHYHVIYGYGIDPDFAIWNKVKNRYLGKRNARKVDNVYRRLTKGDAK